jgi:hypothetical protein
MTGHFGVKYAWYIGHGNLITLRRLNSTKTDSLLGETMKLKISLLGFITFCSLNPIGAFSMETKSVPQITVQTNVSRLLIFGVVVSGKDTEPEILKKIAEQLIAISKKDFDSSGMIQMRLEITRRGNVLIHELSSDISYNKIFSRNAVMFREIPLTLEKTAFVSVIISVDGARFPYMPIDDIDVVAFRDPQTRDVRISPLKNQSQNLTFDSSIVLATCSKAEALKFFEDAPELQQKWRERTANFSFERSSSNASPRMGDFGPYKDKVKQQVAPSVGKTSDRFTLRICIKKDGTPEEVVAWTSSEHNVQKDLCRKVKQMHFDPLPDWYRGQSLILQFGFP